MCQETLVLGQNVECVANIRDYSRESTALVWGTGMHSVFASLAEKIQPRAVLGCSTNLLEFGVVVARNSLKV